MTTVLIVEDEWDLANLLCLELERHGFSPRAMPTGAAALAAVHEQQTDLVVLDVNLPDISGFELCRRIRSEPELGHVAVVMLTARADEADRIKGLEVGADDYVAKPFSLRELVLRLRAVLGRHGHAFARSRLQVGAVRLEQDGHRCFVRDEEIQLTLIEFRLLRQLMREPGAVQRREDLLTKVWGDSTELETRTIDTHVMRLREKLGPARQYLQTVRGVGYCFSDEPAAIES